MTGGLLGSSIVTVVVEGLPRVTPSAFVVRVSVTTSSTLSLSWLPEMVKLAELCPRAMVRALLRYVEVGERRTGAGHG